MTSAVDENLITQYEAESRRQEMIRRGLRFCEYDSFHNGITKLLRWNSFGGAEDSDRKGPFGLH